MNIQFMTEKNGVPTGKIAWDGRPEYRYIPDFEAMKQNASCEDEAKAIEEVKTMIGNGIFDGFAFEIVFTHEVSVMKQDAATGEFERIREWQMLQYPWYRDAYTNIHVSKEQMIAELNERVIGKI